MFDAGNAAGDVSCAPTAASLGADVEALAGGGATGKCLDGALQLLLLFSPEPSCCVPPGGCSSRLSCCCVDAQLGGNDCYAAAYTAGLHAHPNGRSVSLQDTFSRFVLF
jgi:hypothetical protein